MSKNRPLNLATFGIGGKLKLGGKIAYGLLKNTGLRRLRLRAGY